MSRKSNIVLTIALAAIVLSCAAFVYAEHKKAYTEEELGLRKETLYDEDKEYPAHGEPAKKSLERAKGSRGPLRIVHL